MKRRASTNARRKPSEQRSQKVVDAILVATSRVLVKVGYEKLTTSRVAHVAGVSVGALDRYFPSKEALVAALIDAHVTKITTLLSDTMSMEATGKLDDVVRKFVTAVLRMHSVEPELHAVLTHSFPDVGGRPVAERVRELNDRAAAIVEGLLVARKVEVRPENARLAAFVLVRAVQAVVSDAVRERQLRTDDDELARELTALVLGYLRR